MKIASIGILLATAFGMHCAVAQKKEFKEIITKEVAYEATADDPYLEVQNLNGSITVEGYDGKVVLLEVEKSIDANNSNDLELGKQEIGINVLKEGNKIIVYPKIPNMVYRDGRFTNSNCDGWQELAYDYNLNFKVKMPKNSKLKVGTINQGEVVVKNTRGSFLEAQNINGGIVLESITGQTKVHCINGAVTISYAENPREASSYYALNGDINITYQKNLSADIAFKSMNGDLFTDFDIAKQFAKSSKDESGKGGKARYKYESKPVVQIGNGGMDFEFETLNGNVIIKKI